MIQRKKSIVVRVRKYFSYDDSGNIGRRYGMGAMLSQLVKWFKMKVSEVGICIGIS